MRSPIRRTVAAATLGALVLAPNAFADDPATRSNNPDYAAFDDDNQSRSQKKQQDQAMSQEYGESFRATAFESHLENQVDQLNEADQLRVHATLGNNLPGGSVGNPEAYTDVATSEVDFVFRDGAKLEGHIFHSTSAGPGPGVVITTGSIQGTQHMYWWAARTLALNGYSVLTWDVQGQGESETTGHDTDGTPNMTGVPFQQGYNFTEGTVDALKWFTSTPDQPYIPTGWTQDDVDAYDANASDDAERIDWFNPAHIEFDGENLGLAGHSLGAGSVSVVQQCSDHGDLWQTLPICDGTSFPIDAVIGWDRLGSNVTPVVPGMDQQADGYFFNASPSETAPNADGHLTAFDAWTNADVDTMSITVRGGTHIEWTEIPYILPSTEYGVFMADYYTLAWMDAYVHPHGLRKATAKAALRNGLDIADRTAANHPWKANFLSGRYNSARAIGGETPVRDLRAASGAASVGDWAALNDESAEVRYDWDRSGLSENGYKTTHDKTGGS